MAWPLAVLTLRLQKRPARSYGCLSGIGSILTGGRGTPAMTFSRLCPLNVLPVISLLSPLTGGPEQACPLSLLQPLLLPQGHRCYRSSHPVGAGMLSLGCVCGGRSFLYQCPVLICPYDLAPNSWILQVTQVIVPF